MPIRFLCKNVEEYVMLKFNRLLKIESFPVITLCDTERGEGESFAVNRFQECGGLERNIILRIIVMSRMKQG